MSTTLNEYPFGSEVKCSVVFKSAAEVETDPTTVTFRVRNPEGTPTVYIYGTHAQVVRTAAGRFYVLVDGNMTRTWVYRFEGTGAVKAADEQTFLIAKSVF